MNHKRRKPRVSRAGCLMCKTWKACSPAHRQRRKRRWQKDEQRANEDG